MRNTYNNDNVQFEDDPKSDTQKYGCVGQKWGDTLGFGVVCESITGGTLEHFTGKTGLIEIPTKSWSKHSTIY